VDSVSFNNLSTVDVECVNNQTAGATQHQKTAARVESIFFRILCSEPTTSALSNYDPEHSRAFYKLLKGVKTDQKLKVLNNCMQYYVQRTFRRKDGTAYQPNTVETRLKTLFGVFMRNGILYSLKKDFNYAGGFAKGLQVAWEKVQQNDSSFGARPTKTVVADDYGQKVRAAVKEGRMDAEGDDPFELLVMFAFSLGTMFAFRGIKVRKASDDCLNEREDTNQLSQKEYYNLKFEHLSTGKWPYSVPGVGGHEYLEVLGTLGGKTNKLSLSNPTFYAEGNARRVAHNPDDLLSPLSLFRKIRKRAHHLQEYVFCHTMSKSVQQKR